LASFLTCTPVALLLFKYNGSLNGLVQTVVNVHSNVGLGFVDRNTWIIKYLFTY